MTRTRWVAMAAALLLAACATSGPPAATENAVEPGFVPPAAGALIVLLPPRQNNDLAAGDALAMSQLGRQLREAGWRVALLEPANHDELWRQETEAVGGVFDAATGAPRPGAYGRAMSNLAQRLCSELHCALVMEARVQLRPAKLEGQSAAWDGQQRRVILANTAGSQYSFKGTTSALSVHLLALQGDGRFAFRQLGGASLIAVTDTFAVRNELRKDLFDSDVEIGDGVRIALAPLRVKR